MGGKQWASLGALLLAALPMRVAAQVPGTIVTVAGTGQRGFSGDGGPATAATLRYPSGIAVDGSGNLFIADAGNHRIRKVSPDGTITTVVGTGVEGFSGDGGLATAARLSTPGDVVFDALGSLIILDAGNHRVRKVSPDGTITTVAGGGLEDPGGGGPATRANLNEALHMAVDSAGDLFISEPARHRVHKVSPDGTITTVAGSGELGFSPDGSPATAARLFFPIALAVDSVGNLFVTVVGNYRVRKVSPDGTITTVAGGGLREPENGVPATEVRLSPGAVAVDRTGNLLIVESHRILKVFGVAAPGLLGGRPFP